MKKIGILFGMENTFPPAFVEKVNSRKVEGVSAEFVKIGGIKMGECADYAVIVDRISHDIPFYRAYLKNAVLNAARIALTRDPKGCVLMEDFEQAIAMETTGRWSTGETRPIGFSRGAL